MTSNFNIMMFFNRLLEGIREGNLVQLIKKENVMHLLHKARKVFLSQPMLLKINGPVIVCGDLHGQFNDIVRVFESEGFPNVTNYLFLGDYVDRGQQQIELILFMFACKIRYPNNFFMLRGNHETQNINNAYGFHDAVLKFYEDEEMYRSFQRTFELMPLAALISSRILCMHGGLSPPMLDAPNLEIINNIVRPLEDNQITQDKNQLAVDLLWADPDVNVRFFGRNPRGAGCTFGQEVINQVLRRFKLDLIIRAHQVVQDGYEFFGGNPNSGLMTLFTAPHYCGLYDNAGAILRVTGDLGITPKIFQPGFQTNSSRRNGKSEGK